LDNDLPLRLMKQRSLYRLKYGAPL
jgi:hypothetical protein